MAESKPAKRNRKQPAKSTTGKASKGFTDEERAAIRDRALAKRLHTIVKDTAPGLSPRTWHGMPAYAKDGKVVCFFQSAQKFKSRYAAIGFSDTSGSPRRG
jgi:hypothetical protein